MHSKRLFLSALAVSSAVHAVVLCLFNAAPISVLRKPKPPPQHSAIRIRLASVIIHDEAGETEKKTRRTADETKDRQTVAVTSDGSVRDETYWDSVRKAIAAELRYPALSRRRGVEDTVMVSLQIDPSGRLIEAKAVPPPADAALTREVLRAIHRAAPFPAPHQQGPTAKSFSAELPITFRLE
ncbi:MAG: energy transducer TonB [Verrucomicrobia bacterium]|nr:energy transducer TonB [Verrucomicrobiota bacterium]